MAKKFFTDESLGTLISEILNRFSNKADKNHTHNYAGSSSAGGAATSANKLNTNAGSATQPVYFEAGVPKATTYTLGKSVPSNAVFTDTNTKVTQTAITDTSDYTDWRTIPWGVASNATEGFSPSTLTNAVNVDSKLQYQPSTGTLKATTFKGALKGNADTATTATTLSGLTATVAELNKMDGVTATASEINKVDGLTATTTELNYVKGVTSAIQTQLNGKATSSHNHSASNITSGTLPITRGGTGASDKVTAAQNLNVLPLTGGTVTGITDFSNGLKIANTVEIKYNSDTGLEFYIG